MIELWVPCLYFLRLTYKSDVDLVKPDWSVAGLTRLLVEGKRVKEVIV